MQESRIEHVAVRGAGSMGHGIAESAAITGYEMTRDSDDDLVQDSLNNRHDHNPQFKD